MGNEQQQYIEEDEIDLREYINVIIKRKKLILGIFLAAVVVTAIISLTMPKVYEITSTIQLGSVNGLVMKSEDAKTVILNQNSLSSIINRLNLKMTPEELQKDIKINDVGGTNLLKIQIIYPGIDMVLKINDAIVNPFIVQGQAMYQERLAIINERLKELNEEIKNAEGDIARTQALISEVPTDSSVSQSDISLRIILLQNTLSNYESNLSGLRSQRNGMKLMLTDAKDFKVFDAPIRPKYPVGPKKKQNVILAGILSLMFGIFLAFVLEFLQKNKTGEAK
ncbi:MAG: Wzz/FepE/Etk N-terminal domain-containing protein [Candidatus Omnitrophica bacterium]|nr:Wzz/FepE/Etk N-terminal domain-containing protein [Candidatus Omnitrophota bacterium]